MSKEYRPDILPEYKQVISAIEPFLTRPPIVIAIDGRDMSGKTTLGRYLAWHFNMTLIETDLFRIGNGDPYSIRAAALLDAVNARLNNRRSLIIEGIVLLQTLHTLNLQPDLLVYMTNKDSDGSLSFQDAFKKYEKDFMPKAFSPSIHLSVDIDRTIPLDQLT